MDLAKSKVEQWRQFSAIVEKHIAGYVVKQYGDLPDKMVHRFTPQKIQGKLEHYVERIDKPARGPENIILDPIKIAHFASYLYVYLTEGNSQAAITMTLQEAIDMMKLTQGHNDL